MEITPARIKELRECTGAGMMDCKKALTEAQGDMDRAVDLLRTKGLADLAKKAGRATNEGVIGSAVTDDAQTGVIIEVNCETDFVSRNEDFRSLVADLADHVLSADPAGVEAMLAQPFTGDTALTVEQFLGEKVTRIGENMGVARFARFTVSTGHGVVSSYIHGVGNIGVLVECSAGSADAASSEVFRNFARDVAMQIAAASPISVSRDDIPADVVAHEIEIYRAQAAESGKPEPIQEKIAQGRLEKYYKEVCLLEQPFVKDPDISVGQLAERVSAEAGAPVTVVRFARFLLGDSAKAAAS